MADPMDKAREEFFSETQEIIENFSKNLLALDTELKQGTTDPALINDAFRAIHTLKGLAGLFGAARLGTLAHRLEDLLDDLRLGRVQLTAEVLDVLFSSVDAFSKILQAEKSGGDQTVPEAEALLKAVGQLSKSEAAASTSVDEYELDAGMLSVLTEYEEHRLRTNLEQGLSLYRLRVQFDLATIDKALEEMKERAKKHGEIITYLPTGEATSIETIELDLLVASRDDLATLIGTLGADNVVIEEIPRRGAGTKRTGHPAAAATSISPTGQSQPVSERASQAVIPDREQQSLRSLSQTVRVDIRRLDHLMNIVGELAIVRGNLARIADRLRTDGQRKLATELQRLHRNFDRRLSEMQDGILEVRMVPLGQVFDRLARVVRQIGRDAGKEIRLVITGAETEIDKLIVEELSDPLMHMIRNAIDHGIESAEERQAVGKPQAGTIALNAFQKGNHVMIEIEDDGHGIDEASLVNKAVSTGKLEPQLAPDLTRGEVLNLIFLPGLSTREQAGDLSGRGVGMDIVKTNIGHLGGVIDVQSEPGIGTKMTITLPITLAIVSALIVRISVHTFAIPLSSVTEAITFDPRGTRLVDGREVMTLRGTTLPVLRLCELFDFPVEDAAARRFVVVVSLGNRRLGLVVDHLYGQQDIVIKSLGKTLSRVRGFSGATELGDERVGLVLDAAALIEEALAGMEPGRDRVTRLYG